MSEQQRRPNSLIMDPKELAEKIKEWQANGFNVLSPAMQVSSIAQGYGVSASLVQLDYRVDERGSGLDVYFDKATMKGDGDNSDPSEQRGLSKIGLNKIAQMVGVEWSGDPLEYGRVDPFTQRNLWIYRVTGSYLTYSGTRLKIKGEKEIDYRDESAQIGGWSPKLWADLVAGGKDKNLHINGWSERRVMQARCNGAERAETGAMERAIRTLGLKHVYTIQELSRPFVMLRVVEDLSDPDLVRERVRLQAASERATRTLYQGSDRQALNAAPLEAEYDLVPRRQAEPVVREAPREFDQRQVMRQPEPTPGPEPPDEEEEKPKPEAAVRPAADRRQAQPEPAKAAEPKLPEGAVHIDLVKREKRKYRDGHKKAGQAYTVWTVEFADGRKGETAFGQFGQIIDDAERGRLPVLVTIQHSEQWNKDEITGVKVARPEVPSPAMAAGGMSL